MENIVAVITARGGSQGIPGKNIKPLGGVPLIEWTIRTAIESQSISRVIVSTDDDEIARVSRICGAEVPFRRPAYLAADDSSHIDVILHALDWLHSDGMDPDGLLTLQPTTPFRSIEDIDQAAALARASNVPGVVSVTETDVHPTACYAISPDGRLRPFLEMDNGRYIRRQELQSAYVVNGAIYLTAPEVIRRDRTLEPTGAIPLVMPLERSIDIDTPLDFQWAEFLISREHAQPVRTSA